MRLGSRKRDGFILIDTPTTGKITDTAKDVADFVIVPTSPTGIDLQQTVGTVEKLKDGQALRRADRAIRAKNAGAQGRRGVFRRP